MLEHPAAANAPARSEDLIERLRSIEGPRGLNWRWQRARLALARPGWATKADEIAGWLEGCVRQDPTWVEPALALARLRVSQGRSHAAISVYRNLLSGRPGSPAAAAGLIELLEARGLYAEVDQILSTSELTHRSLLDCRARQALRHGDKQRATELLERKRADGLEDVETICLLARVYMQSGREADADRVIAHGEQEWPDSAAVARARVNLEIARQQEHVAISVCDKLIASAPGYESLRLKAETLASLGNVAEAEATYRRLAEVEGSARGGWRLLARFLGSLGRSDEALEVWRRAADADSPNGRGLEGLIGALLDHGGVSEYTEAKALLSRLLEQVPAAPGSLIIQARMLASGGERDFDKARDLLETVVQRDPTSIDAWRALAAVVRRRGLRLEQQRILDRALAANPLNVELLLSKAELVAEGEPLLGVALARQAVGIEPSDPRPRVVLAKVTVSAGQTDRAIQELGGWLSSVKSTGALAAMGFYAELLCRSGRYDAAEQVLERAASLGPWHEAIVRSRLLLAVQRGSRDEVERVVQNCLKHHGGNRILLMGLGGVLLQQDERRFVELAYDLFRRSAVACRDALHAWLGAALAAHKAGHIDAAEESFRRALELSPRSVEAHNGLAWLLCEDRQDAQAALSVADRGVAHWPENVHLLDTRGVILFRLNRLGEAEKELKRALSLTQNDSPTGAAVRFHLARVLAARREQSAARRWFNEALAMAENWGGLSTKEQTEARLLSKELAVEARECSNGEAAVEPGRVDRR
jgi:tetratricopeptide (TPR) repeat protein